MNSPLQDLPPESAHFCLHIEHFLEKELLCPLHGKTLILACSGGVDSSALLLFCRSMQSRWGITPIAAHLDHRLRPESADDARAVAALCQSAGVPCFFGSSEVKRYAERVGLGIEAAGRRLRYRFLEGVRTKTAADCILTGHHLNDLAEDSIMRQLRGAGWPALAGMAAWDPGQRLLRPFLLTPKKKLVRFVTSAGWSWREDHSNEDMSFHRNRIRQRILPRLLEENPRYLDSVAQLWRQAGLDGDYWSQKLTLLRPVEQSGAGWIFIPDCSLRELQPALRLRWYRDILNRLGQEQTRAVSLLSLERAWIQQSIGKTFQFPGRKTAKIQAGGIVFQLCLRQS